jgi:hypothetical protein
MDVSETEPRHVYVHLGDLEPGAVVHIYVGASANGGSEHAARPPAAGPAVEDSLKRLKDWSTSPENIQAAYDDLVAMGLTPRAAGTRGTRRKGPIQPYLAWVHPSHPRGAVGYLNAATFSFIGKNDVPKVAGLPGANTPDYPSGGEPSEVRFPVTSPEGVRQALAAVRLIVGGG